MLIIRSADQVYGDILKSSKLRTRIKYDGSIAYYPAGKTTTSCLLDLTFFPFDAQVCDIRLESWTAKTDRIKLVVSECRKGLSSSPSWHLCDHEDV